MPKFAFDFIVTVKIKAESEKEALKVAKEVRNIAVNAAKVDGRSTVKATPVAACGQ